MTVSGCGILLPCSRKAANWKAGRCSQPSSAPWWSSMDHDPHQRERPHICTRKYLSDSPPKILVCDLRDE